MHNNLYRIKITGVCRDSIRRLQLAEGYLNVPENNQPLLHVQTFLFYLSCTFINLKFLYSSYKPLFYQFTHSNLIYQLTVQYIHCTDNLL